MSVKSKMQSIGAKGLKLLGEPVPLRLQILRVLDTAFNFLPYPAKVHFRSIDRPQFGHCLLHAARLARKLGHQRSRQSNSAWPVAMVCCRSSGMPDRSKRQPA